MVRKIYSIEGNLCADWVNGCCCPLQTIRRVESELVTRENERRKSQGIRDGVSPFTATSKEAYRTEPRMLSVDMLPPEAIGPLRSKAPSTISMQRNETEIEPPALTTIPEVRREASLEGLKSEDDSEATDGSASRTAKQTLRHALEDDVTIPVDTADGPLVKFLGHE